MAAQPLLPAAGDQPECWPSARLDGWLETCATLQLWTQMVGKVRLALTPRENHWWNVPLYLSARGLATSAIPYDSRHFEFEFDFISHDLVLRASEGRMLKMPLRPVPVADFYREFLDMLHAADIAVKIWPMPVELPNPIRFDHDRQHAAYDREVARVLWTILRSADRAFHRFRAGFIGKNSPVHFFWGSFDLAVTRFSGRPAPPRPNADAITREAYSHEVSSVGFWPGSAQSPVQVATFYAYAAPEPPGFRNAPIRPAAAYYHSELGEFLLDYEAVRALPSPSAALLEFCQTTYAAAADLGRWDRAALEA
ncbi:MAG: DUF5996 family protein [Terriglobales bacterium]